MGRNRGPAPAATPSAMDMITASAARGPARVSFKRLAKAGLPSSHRDVVEFKKAALKARRKPTPAAHEAYKALERKLLVISGQQAASDISERVDSAVQKMNGALTDLFEIRGGAVDVAAGLSSCSELLQSKKRKPVSGARKEKGQESSCQRTRRLDLEARAVREKCG